MLSYLCSTSPLDCGVLCTSRRGSPLLGIISHFVQLSMHAYTKCSMYLFHTSMLAPPPIRTAIASALVRRPGCLNTPRTPSLEIFRPISIYAACTKPSAASMTSILSMPSRALPRPPPYTITKSTIYSSCNALYLLISTPALPSCVALLLTVDRHLQGEATGNLLYA